MSPLKLIPRPALPPFTFSLSPSHPSKSSSSSSGTTTSMPSLPPSDFFPERDMLTFGAHPLMGGRGEKGRGLVACDACGRVTMESSWAEHQRICKHILEGTLVPKPRGISGKSIKATERKRRRASEDSDEGPSRKKPPKHPTDRNVNILASGSGKSAISGGDLSNKAIKLKKTEMKRLHREKERLEKKEMKEKEKAEAAERKRQRVSGPINLDKQCGVINDKGHPCARSLTCKTHQVGAKRSVPGRTRGYDELYLEWQRANNPKFKEPTKIMTKKSHASSSSHKHPSGGGGGKDKGKYKGDDDDFGGGRMMGEAEVRELVQFARMAGERCRLTINSIGGHTDHRGGSANSSRYSPSTISSGASSAGSIKSRSSTSTTTKYRQSQHASSRSSFCSTSSRGSGGGYGDSSWGGGMAFAGVGEALIQALAARPARIEPIRLVVPANPAASSAAGTAAGASGTGPGDASGSINGSVPPPLPAATIALPGQAKKQQRPTGLSMPANQNLHQAQMVLQAQVQAQAQLNQAQAQVGNKAYPAHLQQQVQHLQNQGMSAQAMIAAAASAASAVNAGMAGLQGGGQQPMGMGIGMAQGNMGQGIQMPMSVGGQNGMSMIQQYQHGLMQQQQAGMMQAGAGGMYGTQS